MIQKINNRGFFRAFKNTQSPFQPQRRSRSALSCTGTEIFLSLKKERDKIRHIIHCQYEKIPTRNGRPLYLTDESKSRKTCLCCGDDYSNLLPTGL